MELQPEKRLVKYVAEHLCEEACGFSPDTFGKGDKVLMNGVPAIVKGDWEDGMIEVTWLDDGWSEEWEIDNAPIYVKVIQFGSAFPKRKE